MEQLSRFIRSTLTPVIYLSCGGMIAGGGALALSGYWGTLWSPVVVFFAADFILPILMIPAAFFGGLMQVFLTRKPMVSKLMQACAVGWLIGLFSMWGAVLFATNVQLLLQDSGLLLPALAWCVSAPVAPVAFFARADRANLFFTGLVAMFWAGTAVAAIITALQGPRDFSGAFMIIAGVMAALSLVQAAYEEFYLKKSRA